MWSLIPSYKIFDGLDIGQIISFVRQESNKFSGPVEYCVDLQRRMMLADNEKLPIEVLKKLAKDSDERVRNFSIEQLEERQKNPNR